MLLNKFIVTLIVSSATLGLIGCCGSDDKYPNNVTISYHDEVPTSVANEPSIASQEQAMFAKKVLYFSFDSHDLNLDTEEIIAAHASMLLKNPALSLTIIGHTDNRGSQEYNLGLGMLRAQAVARALECNGVPKEKLSLVSYGKTRPIAVASNELGWSQNRRVELIYKDNNERVESTQVSR